MSDANHPEHGITSHPTPGHGITSHPAPAGHALFPPAEVDAFHAADKMAGTYIVGLLASIFILAIIGYLFVCYWVAAGGA